MCGTFEHALNHLLDHAIDLSHFDACYGNDTTGAPAYTPARRLKLVLFACSQGIVSSRGIERACQPRVTFLALCGDTAPHVTTLAQFVSTLGPDIAHVFAAVLAFCDQQGRVGREMFAIDGVKLPSHPSTPRRGTRADCARQAAKLEAAATTMLARHGETDAQPVEPDVVAQIAGVRTDEGSDTTQKGTSCILQEQLELPGGDATGARPRDCAGELRLVAP